MHDLAAIQERFGDDLRPTNDRYTILLIDRHRPLSHPDNATVSYETNDISNLSGLPPILGMIVVAIRDDGAVIELT